MLHVLNDSGARVLIFDDGFTSVVQGVMDAHPPAMKNYVCMPITGAPLPKGKNLHDFNEIVTRQSHAEIDDVIIWERDIAEIAYTSGATAAPKAAMISHLSMYLSAVQTLIEMSLRSECR